MELVRRAREERFSDHSDGVFSFFFASLRDPSLVRATTLSVPEQPGRSALDTLVSPLEDKQMMLLLDNLEHRSTLRLSSPGCSSEHLGSPSSS